MYGTVARMRLKPGAEAQMADLMRQYETLNIPGQRMTYVYRMDNDPNTVMETGLYNLTQNTTPVLTHFGPDQTATYVFARLPEQIDCARH